jgi:hypothetical protein
MYLVKITFIIVLYFRKNMESICSPECREWYRFGKQFEEVKTKLKTSEIQGKLTKEQKNLLKTFIVETSSNVYSKNFSVDLFITAIAYIQAMIEIVEQEITTKKLNKKYTDFMHKQQDCLRCQVEENFGQLQDLQSSSTEVIEKSKQNFK